MSVVIIGAGISGLAAAYYLEKLGYSPLVIEKSETIGGRIRTDNVKGFLLDRGFQLILSSYKALFEIIPFSELQLKPFPNAVVIRALEKEKIIRSPLSTPLTLKFSTWNSFGKLALLSLKARYGFLGKNELSGKTLEVLRDLSLEEEFLNEFLVPFFRGVFLSEALEIPLNRFLTLIHNFAFGKAYLPKEGIQAVPKALKNKLLKTKFLFNRCVREIKKDEIVLDNLEKIKADSLILAIDYPSAKKLFQEDIPHRTSCPATFFYMSLPKLKSTKIHPYLYLDGSPASPINNFSFPSLIQSSYAPDDKHLLVITVVSKSWQQEPDLQLFVKGEISRRLEVKESALEVLSAYNTLHVLPSQNEPPHLEHLEAKFPIYLAGEVALYPSIQEAILSGKKAAHRVHQNLSN